MVRNAERERFVQFLSEVARACGLQGIRGDASRTKVNQMMENIRRSTGPEDSKASAETTFVSYEATFPATTEAAQVKTEREEVAQAPSQDTKEFRLRGRSFLCTYNWDFLSKALPDGTPPPATAEELWCMWVAWKEKFEQQRKVTKSSSTLEKSLASDQLDRLHVHWKVDLKDPVDHTSTVAFAFRGVRPDARSTWHDVSTFVTLGAKKKARGASFEEARNRGHFYCWAPKLGTLFVNTNYEPFKDYRVAGRWLEDLWADGKLSHDSYYSLSLRARKGHASRKRDLDVVRTDEASLRIDERIQSVDGALAQLKAPPRDFPQVTKCEDSFLNLAFRWKILMLCADSSSGKSTFAESRLDSPYVLTVEDAQHLDLRGYDYEKNDGVVLDNVNSWAQLLRWRAVLQARNAKSMGGQNATNIHAYPQYLYGVPIIATIDLDTPDAYLVDADSHQKSNWLLQNCEILRLPAGECFYDKTRVPQLSVPNEFSLFAQTVKRRRKAAEENK